MQDKAYSQILDEVRPFYGKDGFIDEEACSKKFTHHSKAWLNDRQNSILLMRALAWYELILSDGQVTRIRGMREQIRLFRDALGYWSTPVNSFHFTRTMAICIFQTHSHDTFTGNRLIERLYARKPSDTELERHYIFWSAINPTVKQNRTTLVKLLAKQEQLEFRKKARYLDLAETYKFVAIMEQPLSRNLNERGISFLFKYVESLPPGHVNNNAKFKKMIEDQAQTLRGYFKDR